MAANRSELFSGLDLLLEAAEYHITNMVMPPCNKKRTVTSSSPSPPSSQMKQNQWCDRVWLRSNPRSPSNVIKFSPIKKSSKRPAGSAHRVWERTNECAMARRYFGTSFQWFESRWVNDAARCESSKWQHEVFCPLRQRRRLAHQSYYSQFNRWFL